MSTKYGHAFKLNYTVQRGFHAQLLIGHNTVMREFPDEIEIVSIIFISEHNFSEHFQYV